MHALIEPLGGDFLCRSPDTRPAEIRLDGDSALTVQEDWANRYESAVHSGDAAALLGIGRELFDWLDDADWATAWVRATGSRSLQIRVDDPNAPLGRALLDAPWELLATKDGHLADDAVQLLELVRRIGAVAEPIAPRYSDLQLLFMTAAPTGQSVLSYEAEETAILEATERLPLHLRRAGWRQTDTCRSGKGAPRAASGCAEGPATRTALAPGTALSRAERWRCADGQAAGQT